MSLADSVLPSGTRASRLALATLSGILFLTFLDTTIMSVALSDLQATLHTCVSDIQWIVNAYALHVRQLSCSPSAALGDRLGRSGSCLPESWSSSPGPSSEPWRPIPGPDSIARGIMGIGAAACEPGTLSILRHSTPSARARARALGIWAAIAGLALAMGPVVGGMLVGARRLAGHLLVQSGRRAGVRVRGRAPHRARELRPRGGPRSTGAASSWDLSRWAPSSSPSSSARPPGYSAPMSLPCSPSASRAGALFVFVELRSKAPDAARWSTCADRPSPGRWSSPSPPTSACSPSSS